MLLMIFSMTTRAEDLNLKEVPQGYFVSESLAEKLFELYPDVKPVFENAMRVEPGSYMNDDTTIKLGNRIEEKNAEAQKFKSKFETCQEALEEEREAQSKVQELLEAQSQGWKEMYYKSQNRDLVEKAGLAAIIALLVHGS